MKWIKKQYDTVKIVPLFFVALGFMLPQYASAMPVFARQYNVSCTTCHVAFPRLNSYGEQFMDNNMRMPNWRETTADVGDEKRCVVEVKSCMNHTQNHNILLPGLQRRASLPGCPCSV